jgi:hypothetical protein
MLSGEAKQNKKTEPVEQAWHYGQFQTFSSHLPHIDGCFNIHGRFFFPVRKHE